MHSLHKLAVAAISAGSLCVTAAASATPAWLPAEPVAGGGARELRVDTTPTGALTLVWAGQASGSPAIIAGARPPGGPYAPPAPISQGAGEVGAPSLAVAPSGIAVAAWAQRNPAGAWVVRAAVREPTGVWGPPLPLSVPAPSDQQPRAAIADNGEILVAWHGPVVTITAVQVARRSPAGVWSPTPTDVSLKRSRETRLVMDGAGNATVLWLQRDSDTGPDAVAVATRPAGGTWSSPHPLTTGGEDPPDASLPDLAVGPDGRVSAVWCRFPSITESSTHAPGTAAWTGPEFVGPPSFNTGERPVIALDAAGTATVAWSSVSQIRSNRRPASGPWAPTTTVLSARIFPDVYRPVVAVAPSGPALIAWYAQDGNGPAHLQAAIHAPATGWSAAQELGELGPRPTSLADAIDEQGNGTVIWAETSGAIRSRTYDAAGPDLLDVSVPGTATAGEPVALSVKARDRWSPIDSPVWDFGDGATATGQQVTHVFGAGTYTVAVRSDDVLGNATTTARTLTVVAPPPPPPPPPAPRPTLTASNGTFSARFARSAISGKPALKVAGAQSHAGSLTFVLNGPLRPDGKRGDVRLATVALPAGAFQRDLAIPPTAVAKLLPGAYQLRATGPGGLSATWPLKLSAPPEGVVLSKRMTTSRTGPSLQAVTRAKQLWATFEFLPGATTKRKLQARWYAPNRRKPVASFPVTGVRPFSYWRNGRGLAKGRWRCELVAGKTVVASVAIRIG